MHSLDRREFLAVSAVAGVYLFGGGGQATSADAAVTAIDPITPPDWVKSITRMSYLGPDAVVDCARIGVQVVHGNAVWPYFPLRKDGGGLPAAEHDLLKRFVDTAHQEGMRLVLGLPPSLRCRTCWPIPSGERVRRPRLVVLRSSRVKTISARDWDATLVPGATTSSTSARS